MPDKFCYRIPEYPHHAFGAVAFGYDLASDQPRFAIPISPLFSGLDEMRETMNTFATELVVAGAGFELGDNVVIVPMTFHDLVPLKKEYWKKSLVSFDLSLRSTLFVPFLEKPYKFQLLVTPLSSLAGGKERFAVAMPFATPAAPGHVEAFMKTSDWEVDQLAKYAAMYNPGELFTCDWKTGEFYLPQGEFTVSRLVH